VSISFVCMPIARLMAVPIGFGLKYIKSVADISLRIPYSSLDADDPYIAAWFVFAGILTVIWICAERKREITILTSSLVAVGLAFSLLLSEISVLSHDLVIDVLDVGQGQSIVVTSGAYTALIDCGGNRWPGAGNIATQHLLAGNRRRIDLLLLTHNHADHVNGIEDLLDHVHVECAAVPATEACEETAAFLREKGVGVISVNDNHTVALGKCRIRLFRPIVKESGVEEAMCILVSTGDFDALITGDSAFISERILIEREALHDIELLVAGHHGSGRSTGEKLLDAVRPETAVISVGVNSYGHPSPQAISRLRNRGTDIYRTDLQGGIKISVKG
jgi:competence protein ComEC